MAQLPKRSLSKTQAKAKSPKAVAKAPSRARPTTRGRAAKKNETAADAEKNRRPGGRTERNRLLVANAVLKLVEDGNLDFELQEVAAISGLHRTTIFRRWPDREALIAAALTEHLSHFSVPTTGNWQIDFRRIAFTLRDFFSNPAELAMNRLLVRTSNGEFRRQVFDMWDPLIDSIQETLLDAQRSGEISNKVDHEVVFGMLISTLLTRTLLGFDCEDEFVERLVAQIIRGCR